MPFTRGVRLSNPAFPGDKTNLLCRGVHGLPCLPADLRERQSCTLGAAGFAGGLFTKAIGSNPVCGAKHRHYDCLSLLVNWLFTATAQIGAIPRTFPILRRPPGFPLSRPQGLIETAATHIPEVGRRGKPIGGMRSMSLFLPGAQMDLRPG